MSVENLKNSLPEYAKDLKLNLSSLARTTVLNEQQLWGTLLARPRPPQSATVLREIAEEAADDAVGRGVQRRARRRVDHGHEQRRSTAPRASSDGEYDDQVRAGLRMNIIGNPGVEKADFELWSLAVSAINGCHALPRSARERRSARKVLDARSILEAAASAAIVAGVAQAVEANEILAWPPPGLIHPDPRCEFDDPSPTVEEWRSAFRARRVAGRWVSR